MDQTRPWNRPARSATVVAATIFVAIALAMIWPIVPNLSATLLEPGDSVQVSWLLWWNAEHLFASPEAIFAPPIMAPIPRALAYIEHMRGLLIPFAPIYWLSGNPILAFNLSVLFGYAMSGFGVYLLLYTLLPKSWGSWSSALVSGAIFACNPWRFWQAAHLEQLSASWLALALLCLLVWLRRRRWPWLVGFVAASLFQTLISYYFALILGALIFIVLIYGWLVEKASWRAMLTAMGALAVAMAIVHLPLALEYMRGQTHQVMNVAEQHHFALQKVSDLVMSPQSLPIRQLVMGANPGPWITAERWADAGLLAYLLALWATVQAVVARDRAYRLGVLFCLVAIGAGLALALGPFLAIGDMRFTMPFGLFRVIPGIGSFRAPARLWQVALLGVAILAGLGVWRSTRRWGWLAGPLGLLLTAATVTLCLMGFSRGAYPAPANHPVYGWMRENLPEEAILLHAPLAARPESGFPEVPEAASHYAYGYHERRLVNSFFSYTPDEQRVRNLLLAEWPAPEAMRCLREIGVTHVLVDLERAAATHGLIGAQQQAELNLRELYRDETHQLLEVLAAPGPPGPPCMRYGENWNGTEFIEDAVWNLARADATLEIISADERTVALSARVNVVTPDDIVRLYAGDQLLAELEAKNPGEHELKSVALTLQPGVNVLRLTNVHGGRLIGEDPRTIAFGLGQVRLDGEAPPFCCCPR